MKLEKLIDRAEACILVEGPRWADTKFYANWLLAAAKANALWIEAISDPIFQQQIERLLIAQIPDFNIRATVLLSRFAKDLASITLCLDDEEGEEFAMMVGMGFFVLTGQRYQMVVPTRFDITKVKRAALRLAQTEDAEYMLHPELFVVTMPYPEAKSWQKRLREMDEDHRCADRALALSARSLAHKKGHGSICWLSASVQLSN